MSDRDELDAYLNRCHGRLVTKDRARNAFQADLRILLSRLEVVVCDLSFQLGRLSTDPSLQAVQHPLGASMSHLATLTSLAQETRKSMEEWGRIEAMVHGEEAVDVGPLDPFRSVGVPTDVGEPSVPLHLVPPHRPAGPPAPPTPDPSKPA